MTEIATTLSPGLVLSLGKLANRAALDAQALLLRSDPWRVRAVKFLTLNDGKSGLAWTQTRSGRAGLFPKGTRAQACAAMLQSAEDWQAQLEQALHDLRAHEQALTAGGEPRPVQMLRILALADLREPGAAVLSPLLVSLQRLLAREPYCQVLLLLNVADFGASDARQQRLACRAANLADLHELLSANSPLRARLAVDLGVNASDPLNAQVFLFDRYKEGGWEAKDEAELVVILANTLLAALVGETALGGQVSIQTEEPLYSGVGAAALVYDPAELMESCAARLGAEVLQAEFGANALPELRAIHETAAELSGLYGAGSGWLAELLAGTPFTLRREGDGDAPQVDLHFSDLSFDDLPLEEWGDAISGQDRHFGETAFPAARERLLANAHSLRDSLIGKQNDALESLPQMERLYPGGLAAARKVIGLLATYLQERMSKEAGESDWQTFQHRMDVSLRLLDQVIEQLPQPPRWIRWLPPFLQRAARAVFALLYQREELARLMLLRQQAIRAVEQKYAGLLEGEARQQANELCRCLLDALKQVDEAIQILQAAVYSAQLRLEKRSGLPGRMETPFRQPAVDRAVYEWAYRRGLKPAGEMRYLLLEEHGLLSDWKALDARKIEAALLSFARGLHQFTWQLTLDEVLAQRESTDLSGMWGLLSQGATPLLRPDYDRVSINSTQRVSMDAARQPGAGEQTNQERVFLCQSVKSTPFLPFLRGPLTSWQAQSTGDPFLAFCLRLRQGLPIQALETLRESAAGEPQMLFEAERDGSQ